MSTETQSKVDKGGEVEVYIDTDEKISTKLAAEFTSIINPMGNISKPARSMDKFDEPSAKVDFSQVRELISVTPEITTLVNDIDDLSRHIFESAKLGNHKFIVELPSERPIDIRMVVTSGQYQIAMFTTSNKMRRKLENRKTKMESTIGKQLSSSVKITFDRSPEEIHRKR